MKLELIGGLPFASVTLLYRGRSLILDTVLIDTGSGGSVFSADKVGEIGLFFEAEDKMRRISGVGGSEFVFSKRVNQLSIGDLVVTSFDIEVGEMNYGFELEGIIGMDFLCQVNAVLDLSRLKIDHKK